MQLQDYSELKSINAREEVQADPMVNPGKELSNDSSPQPIFVHFLFIPVLYNLQCDTSVEKSKLE